MLAEEVSRRDAKKKSEYFREIKRPTVSHTGRPRLPKELIAAGEAAIYRFIVRILHQTIDFSNTAEKVK